MAKNYFFDEMVFDESYYPSRLSLDSSEKGKISLHRKFPPKFFKDIYDRENYTLQEKTEIFFNANLIF